MDPEIKAMTDVMKALDGLEPEAIKRVLTWVSERNGMTRIGGNVGQRVSGQTSEGGVEELAGFHELFDAANPQTSADKTLVAAYWFQVREGHQELDAQILNRELRDLGHPSTNITRDFDALIRRTPRHAMQVKKSGTTKQARKKYRLTREGIRVVERMLAEPQEHQ